MDLLGCLRELCCVSRPVSTQVDKLLEFGRETFRDPVLAWDASAGCEILVRAYIVCISADNPMHAEHCSSTGSHSNFPCRVCSSGGSQAERQTEAGFSQLVEVRSGAV